MKKIQIFFHFKIFYRNAVIGAVGFIYEVECTIMNGHVKYGLKKII